MPSSYPPLTPKFPHLLHGCDYNPDQWLHMPQIIAADYRMMQQANCNAMTLGVFSWARLEPREGEFVFGWLDAALDNLYAHGIRTILATPSGARPPWLAQQYPEVLRMNRERRRELFGGRHNHCYTSPVFREKIACMNRKLAERYQDHPGLILWHISNEFCGECHCPLCQQAFRGWLQKRYEHDLDKLNRAWYTAFWSQLYSDWAQIESPSGLGQPHVHGLNLDWMRFVTHQTADYMKSEIAVLKEFSPRIPVTTNLMSTYPGVNYWKLAEALDFVSWDNYPHWHADGKYGNDYNVGADAAFRHDLIRSINKGRPFLLMESTPSYTSWARVNKPKKPGMLLLSSLQAVAHGSDSVQYFQWRQSRGNCEKLHGAVVSHANSTQTRTFREVAQVGAMLRKLEPLQGSAKPAQVAVIFDWENRWAIEDSLGVRNDNHKQYEATCRNHYQPCWARGIGVDIINMDCNFLPYSLLIAPMLYMLRPGVAERLEAFVQAGGTLVTTYLSGIADASDLCFLGGFPGPLRKLLGIWVEETDPLYEEESNLIRFTEGNALGLQGEYQARIYCDVIHAETAGVLATYDRDYYAGWPAVTVNSFGLGKAYYLASRNEQPFHTEFYGRLIRELALDPLPGITLPDQVNAQQRTDGRRNYLFLMNFANAPREVSLGTKEYTDLVTGKRLSGAVSLGHYGVVVLTDQ